MARLLFVGDPIKSLNPVSDTSLALADGALDLGHSVYWSTPEQIGLLGFRTVSEACYKLEHFSETPHGREPHWSELRHGTQELHTFDAVFIRKDPPFDQAYTSLCWMLQLEPNTHFINPPGALLSFHEKTLQFAALASGILSEDEVMPAVVSRSATVVSEALRSWASAGDQHGFIIKPWLGYGGRGVRFCKTVEDALSVYAEESKNALVIVEPYEPAIITTGDVRVIIARDRVLGCFARRPSAGKIASNLAQGGTAHPHTLNRSQLKTIEKLIPFLLKSGILFSGLDMIGDRITEINITSPTGLRMIQSMGQPRVHQEAFSLLCTTD